MITSRIFLTLGFTKTVTSYKTLTWQAWGHWGDLEKMITEPRPWCPSFKTISMRLGVNWGNRREDQCRSLLLDTSSRKSSSSVQSITMMQSLHLFKGWKHLCWNHWSRMTKVLPLTRSSPWYYRNCTLAKTSNSCLSNPGMTPTPSHNTHHQSKSQWSSFLLLRTWAWTQIWTLNQHSHQHPHNMAPRRSP